MDGGRRTRIWPQVLDRGDGSYLARFRLFGTFKGKLYVEYDGKQLGKSPFIFKGMYFNIYRFPIFFS